MEKIDNNKKIVFFGPFVGEFGWELLFWHGWVKRMCRGKYKDYKKIVSSFAGRYPFYPDVDDFWPIPEDFSRIPFSSRNYITDYWQNGLPKSNVKEVLPDVWPRLEKIINDFKEKLPQGAEFIHPWQYRYDKEDKRYYGVKIKNNPQSDADFSPYYGIPYSKQILEKLQPSKVGIDIFEKIAPQKEKIIAIFPRGRAFRRPDKNWPKEKYELLIKLIQEKIPGYKIAILGEPGGAFFADGVPENCLDLINIKAGVRMDVQLAALKRAELSLGSQSGGITFALSSGCKAITWGLAQSERGFSTENYTHTPFVFLPNPNPSVDLVFEYLLWFLQKRGMPADNLARVFKKIFYRIFNPRYLNIFKSRVVQLLKI